MKVAIHHGGDTGFVTYNPGNREIMVTHPDERVRNTVRHYLTNPREFTVAGSSDLHEVGNRILLQLTPNQSVETMVMGLSEMFHHTGVHVNWGHKDNNLKELNFGQPDPNAKADKPIVKSIDGEEYEIIN